MDIETIESTELGRTANPPTTHCAVEGCIEDGKPHTCPYDNRRHYHGCVHYDCGYPKHSLTFRADGWFWMCDKHYAIVVAERAAFQALAR